MHDRADGPTGKADGAVPSGWIEATLQFLNPQEEYLSTFVSECCERGALGSEEHESAGNGQPDPDRTTCDACGKFITVRLYFPGSLDMEAILSLVEETRKTLHGAFPEGTARLLGCRRVQKQDWATDWKKSFEPQRVTDRIWVVPPWRVPDLAGNAIRIVLEPGLAFGTGKHATTQQCLRFLEEIFANESCPPESLLDVGCGSGILSLAGKALGARRVVGLDKDPEAIQVCCKNLALNRLSGAIQLVTGSPACILGRFDLVVANLDGPTLLESAPLLLSTLSGGGRLLLAGFLRSELAGVRDRYERMGLRVISEKRDHEEGWTSLLLLCSDAPHESIEQDEK